MTSIGAAQELRTLMQLDADAVEVLRQALPSVEDEALRRDLMSAKADHERHVTSLGVLAGTYGVDPRPRPRTLDGLVEDGLTPVDGDVGECAALLAVRASEALIASRYEDVLTLDLPVMLRKVLEAHGGDVQRHLASFEQALSDRHGITAHRGDAAMRA